MNSKGMTLIEIIVVIVLLGIIGLFTFDFVGKGVETYIIASNQAGLLAEAKLAMERMTREIRDAEVILAPALGKSSTKIQFNKSHSTVLDITKDITFKLNKKNGILKRIGDENKPLAKNVSNFTVTNNSNEIKLELTLSLTGGENVTLHTKVYPKNLPSQFNGDWEEV